MEQGNDGVTQHPYCGLTRMLSGMNMPIILISLSTGHTYYSVYKLVNKAGASGCESTLSYQLNFWNPQSDKFYPAMTLIRR
jgi:predicted trehalose synthase